MNHLHRNNTNSQPDVKASESDIATKSDTSAKAKSSDSHDFGEGSISGNILRLAIPMTLAQLINVLYNIIDRIYIGHLPDASTQALTGIGLTLPVITIITAFANLFGMGGAPLFSMARGAGEPELLAEGVPAMHLYFFGIFMMSLQFAGQSTFTALGKAKQAVFFSLLRKAIIVIPLTLWLPTVGGLGTNGVFLAEPVSNFIGGTACFVTMIFTVWKKLDTKNNK